MRFAIRKLWLENSQNTQQSTIEFSVCVAALMGEGVGSMEAKARGLMTSLVFGWRCRREILMVCDVLRRTLAEIL
jgi:uncharacterized membrane protein (DUF441 family)